jgi:hypothetical protein
VLTVCLGRELLYPASDESNRSFVSNLHANEWHPIDELSLIPAVQRDPQ